jgi:ankyrin repeat protein/uncharacterized coiled-coil DUF342 family protein
MEKIGPALKDFTVEEECSHDGDFGWEAVLYVDAPEYDDGDSDDDEIGVVAIDEGALQPQPIRPATTRPATTVDDDCAAEQENHDDILLLLNIIRQKKWLELLCRLEGQPATAHVKFASCTQQSTGNFVLHECCRHGAPSDVVECIMQANQDAVTTKGNSGYLPMHYACATNSPSSIDVVQLLFAEYANALCQVDDEEHVLPLHLACKVGADEEVLMVLLSFFPEATKHNDVFGRSPLDYAKSIRNDEVRRATIQCLDQAKWLMSAASFARTRTESQHERKIHEIEDSHAKYVQRINDFHDQHMEALEQIVQTQKEEMLKQTETLHRLNTTIEDQTETIQSLNMTIQAQEDDLLKRTEMIRDLNATIEHQKTDIAKYTETIQTLNTSVESKENDALEHTETIRDLRATIEDQKKDLSKHIEMIHGFSTAVQAKKNNLQKQVDTLEMLLKVKDDELKKQANEFEKTKSKLRAALSHQEAKLAEVMNNLDCANSRNKSMTEELKERNEDLDAALDYIQTLSEHCDWLESTIHSMRQLVKEEDSPYVLSLLSRTCKPELTARIEQIHRRSHDTAVYKDEDDTDDEEGCAVDYHHTGDGDDATSVSDSASSCKIVSVPTTDKFVVLKKDNSCERHHIGDDREQLISMTRQVCGRRSVDQGDNAAILNDRE